MTSIFIVQCMKKQLLDSVFVISRIIKVLVRVISLSPRIRQITPTSALIIVDITKTSSNNCLLTCCLALRLMSCFGGVSQFTWRKKRLNKRERLQQAENLRSACCSPSAICKVFAARMTKLITARMLGNARKDHSITLPWLPLHDFCSLCLLCRNFFFLKFEEKCTALVV